MMMLINDLFFFQKYFQDCVLRERIWFVLTYAKCVILWSMLTRSVGGGLLAIGCSDF